MSDRSRPTSPRLRSLLLLAAIALISAGLAGCASPSEKALRGPVWALTATTSNWPAFQGVIPPAERLQYTIHFGPAGRWDGQADCNQVSGTYDTTRRSGLEIMLGPSTMMACPEGSLGQIYLIALSNVVGYDASNARLTLRLDGGSTLEFVASDFVREPESPSPSMEATSEPTAEATPTPKATEKPTPSPSPTPKPTPKPTAAPTAAPTATPKPTPSPSPATPRTCTSTDGGIKVTYPGTWYTVTDIPEYACAAFDPAPISVDPATGFPLASVYVVASASVTYDEALLAATDTRTWRSIEKEATTVSGLPATKVSGIANGAGAYPADTVRYAYFVDRGDAGIVVIQTTGTQDDPDLAGNEQVVDDMAGSIVIK